MASNQLVLDSGALCALAEESESLRFVLRRAVRAGSTVIVPTVVIAESTTGDGRRDARVNRVLKAAMLAELTERTARDAAALRYARGPQKAGTIDAIIVATADAVPGSQVITGDARDLRGLAEIRGVTRVIPL